MDFSLPKIGKPGIPLPHFPSRCMAFLFRAYEYVTPEKIAKLLDTEVCKIVEAAGLMGLDTPCESDIWLKKGYITVIRQMWHLLPYQQLLELLEMDAKTLAVTLREEDFLDLKLRDKPDCAPITWEEPDAAQQARLQEIGSIVRALPQDDSIPFEFTYAPQDMAFSGEPVFQRRIVYPFSGLYQQVLDVDSRTYLPDSMLAAYQKTGVNGLWIQAVLSQLCAFPFAPEISQGWQQRLDRLKALTERCGKYGIKLYLYMNEPRSMEDSFYRRYPELRGHNAKAGKICLCTSTKPVQDYLAYGIRTVCQAAPQLGGIITITRSENPTNCYSHSTRQTCQCPRCSQRSEAEVVAEVINIMEKSVRSVNPEIRIIAWDWSWDEFNLEIIKLLDPRVILQAQSELAVPYTVGGVSNTVRDYSMGIIGPGDRAREEWALARSRGMEVSAKVQVNTTWECSTVPALPVYPLIEAHIAALKAEGVSNLMLSWTLGGYPSRNIQCAAKYFYEHCTQEPRSPAQQQAVECFAEAFREFPFHIDVVYYGPQNAGPSTLLFAQPTGYRSSMTCFAYDDLESWRSIYPREVFLEQFEKLTDKWAEGVALLDKEPWDETKEMATAACSIFRSCRNQIRFYLARERQDVAAMAAAAEDELRCATVLLQMMQRNAAIGFEAANHYYYSKGCLREKAVNCRYLLAQWR